MQTKIWPKKLMFPSTLLHSYQMAFTHTLLMLPLLKYSELLIYRVDLQHTLCQLVNLSFHGTRNRRFINPNEQTKVWIQFKSLPYYRKFGCCSHSAESINISAQYNLCVLSRVKVSLSKEHRCSLSSKWHI